MAIDLVLRANQIYSIILLVSHFALNSKGYLVIGEHDCLTWLI